MFDEYVLFFIISSFPLFLPRKKEKEIKKKKPVLRGLENLSKGIGCLFQSTGYLRPLSVVQRRNESRGRVRQFQGPGTFTILKSDWSEPTVWTR